MKNNRYSRILAVIIAVLMTVSMIPLGALSIGAAPAGTAITNASEFAAMSADGTYYLANDITVNVTYANEFSGIFDGNGKTVTTTCALFDKVVGGTVKNFTVTSALTSVTLAAGGAIVCNTAFDATFKDITNNVSLTSTDNENNHGLAAIVGTALGNTAQTTTITVENCVNNGDIKGDSAKAHAGGIVGFVRFVDGEKVDVQVKNCHNTGDIDSAKSAGIICYLEGVENITVTGCTNTGNMVNYNLGGGIIAQASKTCKTLTVDNCQNAGNISGGKYQGGIVGICQIVGDAFECTGTVVFSNLYNNGTVKGVAGGHGGGIVGRDYGALIEYCGNAGTIDIADAAGGIVGHTENVNITRYCYNLGNVISTRYAGGMISVSKNPLDEVYGCYNMGQLSFADSLDTAKSYGIAQIVSATSTAYGEYHDNFYLEGLTYTLPGIGVPTVIPCNTLLQTPLEESTTAFTAADVTSGKLAMDINAAVGKNVFFQKLTGTADAHPTTDMTRGTVLKVGDKYLSVAIITDTTAAVKIGTTSGLRFSTTINKADHDALIAAGVSANTVSVGTMITLDSYLAAVNEAGKGFTMADFDTVITQGTAYVDDAGAALAASGDVYGFTGAVIDVPADNLEKDYSAVGYIRIGDQIIYSAQYATRNIAEVAEAAYADRADAQSAEYGNAIAANSAHAIAGTATYSPYTEAQLALIKALRPAE